MVMVMTLIINMFYIFRKEWQWRMWKKRRCGKSHSYDCKVIHIRLGWWRKSSEKNTTEKTNGPEIYSCDQIGSIDRIQLRQYWYRRRLMNVFNLSKLPPKQKVHIIILSWHCYYMFAIPHFRPQTDKSPCQWKTHSQIFTHYTWLFFDYCTVKAYKHTRVI